MKKLISILSFAICGCQNNLYNEEYDLYISRDFGSFTPAIINATEKWHTATGVAIISAPLENTYNCGNVAAICIYPGSEQDLINLGKRSPPEDGEWLGLTHREFGSDSSKILILNTLMIPNSDPDVQFKQTVSFQLAALHELGHALGLLHEYQTNNVMYPDIDYAASYPTCMDIAQYYKLRGVDFNCP